MDTPDTMRFLIMRLGNLYWVAVVFMNQVLMQNGHVSFVGQKYSGRKTGEESPWNHSK
jgi:hypothetical protein